MRARYYISFDGVSYSEFWPSNEPVITWTREGTEIFMRPRVDKFRIGRTRNQTVYDDLYSRFFDSSYFSADLYYKVNILGTDKFYFIDPITSGKIDTQNAVYESTPEPNDSYRNILLQYEKKWFEGSSVSLFPSDINYPKLDTGTFVNVDFTTFSDVSRTVSYTNTTNALKYATNDLVVTVTNTYDVVVVVKNLNVTAGDDPRMVLVTALGADCSNIVTLSANGLYTMKSTGNATKVKLQQTDDLGGSSGSLDYDIYYFMSIVPNGGQALVTFLNNVLNTASYMNLSLGTPVSTYLWNDALPTGHAVDTPNISTYITANPTNDYVVEGAAIWNDLSIGRVDQWTQYIGTGDIGDDFEFSLKDVMDLLKDKLRAWWFIDPDGKFRIEHERYFRDFAVQADLTSATYAGDKPEVDVRVYSYEKENVYSQLSYSENNQENEDWLTYPNINFLATLTSRNVRDIKLSCTTDMKYIIDHPDNAMASGFCLLRMVDNGDVLRLSVDPSTITASNAYANGYLSWAYLFANYWDYFAEAKTGTVNNAAFTFTHVREFLKQNNIKFRLTSDLDWKKPFTLTEGKGWLEKAEYSPETGMYKIDVGYDPYAVTIYIVDSVDKTIKITDSAGNLLIK